MPLFVRHRGQRKRAVQFVKSTSATQRLECRVGATFANSAVALCHTTTTFIPVTFPLCNKHMHI